MRIRIPRHELDITNYFLNLCVVSVYLLIYNRPLFNLRAVKHFIGMKRILHLKHSVSNNLKDRTTFVNSHPIN